MKYKFIGQPDNTFPDLVTGKIYDLMIDEYYEGLKLPILGWKFGYKEYPVIISPIWCPYSSWETFYQNWKPVKKRDTKNKLG